MSLAGYAQSSVPGELKYFFKLKNDPILIEACRNSGSVVPYGGDDEFRLIYAEKDLRKLCEMMQGQSNIKRPTAPMEASLKQYHHLSDRDLNSQVTQYIESLQDTCISSCKSYFW